MSHGHNNSTFSPGPRSKCDQVVFEAMAKAAEIVVASRCWLGNNGPPTRGGGGGGGSGSGNLGRFNLLVPEVPSVRYVFFLFLRHCVVLCCVVRMERFVDGMGIKRTGKRESEGIRELAIVLIVRRSTCFDFVAEHGKKERARERELRTERVLLHPPKGPIQRSHTSGYVCGNTRNGKRGHPNILRRDTLRRCTTGYRDPFGFGLRVTTITSSLNNKTYVHLT